jgi:hypothetical protein
MQNEAPFEAPVAHEAVGYSPETPEWEEEFEEENSHYGAPEATHYTPEMEFEEEFSIGGLLGGLAKSILGGEEVSPEMTEFEFEDETNLYGSPEMSHYSQESQYSPEASLYGIPELGHEAPEWEYEDESDRFLGGLLGGLAKSVLGEEEGELSTEWESQYVGEADPFFGKIWRAVKKVGKAVAPIAKRLAPIAAKSLVSMIPGVGAIAAPLAGKLVGSMVQEGEMEAAQLENHLTSLFATNEHVGEAEHPEAHEAALTELLAAEAAVAPTEAEAEADLGACLPITITIMGARRPLRRVMPVLTQANARLVRTLRQQGPAGRQLLRTVPPIQRRAVGMLKSAARRGQPITAPLAVKAMAAATQRFLSNPRQVQKAIQRNVGMRLRTAPVTPRRAKVYAPNAVRRSTTARPTAAAARRPRVAAARRRVTY